MLFTALVGTVNTVHASGEKYSWVSANEISGTGGSFGGNKATFNVTKKYTAGTDSIPSFQTEDIGVTDKDGCIIHATITFTGKNAGSAKFEIIPDLTSGLSCSGYTDKIKAYDSRVTLSNTNKQSATIDTNRTITVRTQVPKEDGDSYTSDKITIKETRGNGRVLATKNMKKADKKSLGTGYVGFEVQFKNLSPSLGYTVCSKYIDKCSGASAIPSTALPIEVITGNTVTINKERIAADDEGTSCAVDGIGWIVCPVVTFLAKLNDAAFGFLNNFLNVPPDIFNDNATRAAWEAFRNIANIAFVIAFLIIIYSQMTGAGITNYGLKKLMPKLIIAAILVNVSYFICQIAVDLSNILGASIYDLIKGINIGEDTGAGGAGSTIWSSAGAVVLGVGAAVGLLALIIFAPMSLLALAMVIMILIARQAFVVLLIVISPLAFVAYLLPNTESWFKKWWNALVTILMVFPIIALVFGASSLASDILMRVSEDGAGGGDDNQLLKIVAAGVLAIPLFAVPVLLKGALAAAGSVGAKLGGLQDKTNGFAKRGIKEGRLGEAKTAWDRRRQGVKAARRAGIGSGVRARANRAFDSTRIGRAVGGPRGAAHATAEYDKTHDEDVKAANTLLQSRMGHLEILNAASTGAHDGKELSEHEREAAIQYAMERGNANERRHILSGRDMNGALVGGGIGTMTRSQRKAAIGGMRAKGETDIFGNGALAALEATDRQDATGHAAVAVEATLAGGVAEAVNNGTLTVEAAGKDHRTAAYVAGVATGATSTTGDLLAGSNPDRTTVTAPARTDFHNAVVAYSAKNPQAWTKLGTNTQGSLGSI